ncbi:ABC-2 type transport system ATP-binding protein [Clostridium cavendishii DSM 21758]|uniref:ABC-2 type transport system ATP-binding protein n=1 Tax=Clostridium cavendishii DSM 21758 TaxID=1121302 RepID=A0A1M6CB60_9CLOT|nr:ABC transporter ATP-binding protein [Clostridium cavendishii]SHI58270.1 ABC-2 type transport system ATP-binding protein [Clostridium cavendishii DSM 21758]
MEVLKVENLYKSFNGFNVIEDLSFSVQENSIFGFIGKNGAGKTTTMKMILGLLEASKGEIYVCGEKVVYGNARTNKYIGYLPDVPEYYGYMKPYEYLKLCGEITGMNKRNIKVKSEELLSLVGLEGNNRKIAGFSRGMKQRLGIAQALLNEPKLVICDEPTSALDPVGRKEILDILYKVKDKTTIIFSTHILSDVERICDTLGLLNNGKIAMSGKLHEIKSNFRSDSIFIELNHENEISIFKEKLESIKNVINIVVNEEKVNLKVNNVDETSKEIIRLLANNNISIAKYEVLEPSLENLFMEVVQ